MIDPATLAALAAADERPASRIRSVLAQACRPPAPCESAAVVELRDGQSECIARLGHGRVTPEEDDAARLAAQHGIVVVCDESEPALVAAPAGSCVAVVVRLRDAASAARVE